MKKKKKIDKPRNALFMNSWPIYNRTVHIHETDRTGVIHFSNYYKIAEEALYTGLNRLGFSFGNFEYAISVISSHTNYYQPIKFANHISVIITDIEIQQEHLTFNFAFNDSDHSCLTETQITFVLVETKNRKTISIPEDLKNKLNKKTANQNKEDPVSSIQIYT